MARYDDIDLMQLHDGELSASEKAEVSAQLDGNEEDRSKLKALEQIGEAVRTHLELAADEVEPALEGIWETVQRRLQTAEPAQEAFEESQRRRKTTNAESQSAGAGTIAAISSGVPARVAREEGGIFAAIRRWLDGYRSHIVTGAVTAGAVAALILVLRPPQEIHVPGPERIVTIHETAPTETMPVVLKSSPATVEYLDVVDGSGTVITIAGDGDEEDDTITIIWIDPNDDKVGNPI